ncbi:MAG: phage baseplate assembly protein V [Cycloclasticus sp.]|jgi:Rhs element Vgr protein
MNDFLIAVSADGSSGDKEKAKIQILDIDIEYSVNEIPVLKLKLIDGNLNKKTFELADSKIFELGMIISVSTADGSTLLFKGLITGLSIGRDQDTYHCVVAHGDAIKMTEGASTQLFDPEITDDGLIKKLMEDTGATAGKVAASTIKHNQYFCYQQTPWRVMMDRVMANGFVFVPSPADNAVIDLQTHSAKEHAMEIYKSEVINFQLELDTRSQIKNISANAWSITNQKLDMDVKGESAAFRAYPDADQVLKTADLSLFSHIPKSPEELASQATAQNNYRLLDAYQGHITLVLNDKSKAASITLMSKLKIAGVGSEFSGDYIVTSIRHRNSKGQWLMEIGLGLSLTQTLQSHYYKLPPMGNQIAKIVEFAIDEKEALERIPIELPCVAPGEKVWARLLSPFASEEEGLYFPPNTGDEVVVGFIDGDCRYPVVLGSCHNPVQVPPQALEAGHPIQGIYVKDADKKMINVVFDRAQLLMESTVGEETKLVIGDADGLLLEKAKSSIAVAETVALNSGDALTLESAKDLSLTSKAKAIIEAQATEIK